ncbi:hypothetical protein PLICRDRAFT_37249 [Plicaturopsis crispa FD-325 SS-3]|nr:hypothetical protein PLICRDRAFT_37249 [Plicaturopsis crispa FD-325 SS-3]
MPPGLFRMVSRRDALLLLLGAAATQLFSALFSPQTLTTSSIVINTHDNVHPASHYPANDNVPAFPDGVPDPLLSSPVVDKPASGDWPNTHEEEEPHLPEVARTPETAVLAHAPGWTVFRDLYMANGTLFAVSSKPASEFPPARMMTSTGLPGFNTPENIAAREPTDAEFQVISVAEARLRWGDGDVAERVSSVDGSTFLFNDPDQFLTHYYHFSAELLFGTQAFWTGAFSDPPPPTRAIFTHASSTRWRDTPGFNAYVLRAAYPGIAVESVDDWEDRIAATVPPSADIPAPHYADVHSGAPPSADPEIVYSEEKLLISGIRGARLHREANAQERAWRFDNVLLVDRSAAHRGEICGSKTQRTASESVEWMRAQKRIDEHGHWWDAVRERVVRFAGGNGDAKALASLGEQAPIVITYISRQGSRRRLREADHDLLVHELEALVARKNAAAGSKGRQWELNILEAQRMSKDEQVRAAARTTILLGVHGNGLTHLLWMTPTPQSAVIEMFIPTGVAHDYGWTTRDGLGRAYYAVWNDTYHDGAETRKMGANYPDEFHGTNIPVYGPTVARLIEEHVAKTEVPRA